MPSKFSEEELKTGVLLPYLQTLGIGPDRIRLERTFQIRLGRSEFSRHAEDTYTEAGGRLDCLVQGPNGDPLFVVEAKQPGQSLSLEDRDQGISYARLLHPIAPFVLVTNGNNCRIYDVISKQELSEHNFPEESEFYRSGRSLSAAVELRRRQEALENFVGYSRQNVRAFSENQRRARMAELRGSDPEGGWKYVPSLYITRGDVRTTVEKFLESEDVVFAMGGVAGVGKTNEACALAESLAEDELVLFFNGNELYGSLARCLSEEFNWEFSQQLELNQIVDFLAKLGRSSDRNVVVIIDAIDESPIEHAPREISNLATHLESFKGRVKLLVTSKWLSWQNFAFLRDDRAPVQRLLYRSPCNEGIPRRYREQCNDRTGPSCARMSFVLEKFDRGECEAAFRTYEKAYQLPHAIPEGLREELSDPFLLRTFAEAYQNAEQLPSNLSTSQLLRGYLDRKLRRIEDSDRAERELVAVAQALKETGARPQAEEPASRSISSEADVAIVPEAQARELAGVGVAEEFADGLVRFGVLARRRGPDKRRFLSFTFDRVQDFVLATRILHLDPDASPANPDFISDCFGNPVAEAALRWYLNEASENHLKVYHDFVQRRMERFLAAYVEARSFLNPSVWEYIEPKTSSSVGLVFDYAPPGERDAERASVAFFSRETSDPPCRYRKGFFAEVMQAHDDREEPFAPIYEIRTVNLFSVLRSPEREASSKLLNEIEELVQKGGLDDSGSETLLHEKVTAILDNNRDTLGYPRHRNPSSYAAVLLATDLYPINLQNVWQRTQIHYAAERFRLEWSNEAARKKREETGQKRVSVSISQEQKQEFERKARQAVLEEGREFPPPNHYVGGRETNVLIGVLDTLRPEILRFENTVLPPPDKSGSEARRKFTEGFSDEQLAFFLESLFTKALNAYETLVDSNFGRLATEFQLYRALPVSAVLYCDPHDDRGFPGQQIRGSLSYGFVSLDGGDNNRAEATLAPSESPFEVDRGASSCWGHTRAGTRELQGGITTTSLSSIVRPSIRFPIEWGVSPKGAEAQARIRTLAFRWIRRAVQDWSAETVQAHLDNQALATSLDA